MDILSLPDLVQRRLMRKMMIKDRLNLRLTCRAFERLVADTHAGCFDYGRISHCTGNNPAISCNAENCSCKEWHGHALLEGSKIIKRGSDGLIYNVSYDQGNRRMVYSVREQDGMKHIKIESALSIALGDASFNLLYSSTDDFEQLHNLIKRLFSGISFNKFEFKLDDRFSGEPFLEFIHKLAMEIRIDHFVINQFVNWYWDSVTELIVDYPNRKHSVDFESHPVKDVLLAIPALEKLSVSAYPIHYMLTWPVIHRLIATHKTLVLGQDYWQITTADLMAIMQVVSEANSERSVQFGVMIRTITSFLDDYNIPESAQTGDIFGEFEVCEVQPKQLKVLRYRNCGIRIEISEPLNCGKFTISNVDEQLYIHY
ncbi:hypothetical protein PENTCL1PPCAC_20416 [Pristionchus entomophagus]|uniref:F-box domain-containing protein n=1 Tax=Pristionchus entomophagus TaxID=358040 RepID=A0AAV5TVH6_9BILA|nr:hypothetical protein PENTCL1PPCAC_20416 [Pristionchus entomophagus]